MDEITALAGAAGPKRGDRTSPPAVLVKNRWTIGSPVFRRLMLDGCILTAHDSRRSLVSIIGLNIDRAEIPFFLIHPASVETPLAAKMLTSVERLAVRFGLAHVDARPESEAVDFMIHKGYRAIRTHKADLRRSISHRKTRQIRKVTGISRKLGIPLNYGVEHRLPMVEEQQRLFSIGMDVFNREQKMQFRAASQWRKMVLAAQTENIGLQPVSAFRSIDHQARIVQAKLKKGQSMDEILSVSAPPGYSEHHTGRAVDITQAGYDPLEEEFEHSPAFSWLSRNAADFGYSLSFPRNNRHGIAYEPWHWKWSG
jgi:D-alanyl-D-alanine carboxypeptidase